MKIDRLVTEIESAVKELDDSQEPGFSCGIVQDGDLVFSVSCGLENMETQTSLSNKSLYYLASESKQFTAACILHLVYDGLLKLDDDIRDIVEQSKQFNEKIPIQNLLNHTSGIPDYLDYMDYQLNRRSCDYFDNKDALKLIEYFDFQKFKVNEKHAYSNSNYILLMAAVQNITNLTPAQYAKQKIFEPLGMTHTLFDDDRFKIIKNRVHSYYLPDIDKKREYKLELKNSCTVGDGGVLSNIHDLARWEANIHKNTGLPESVISGLFHTHPLSNGTQNYYANGTEISPPESRVRYSFHGGGFEGFRTLIFRVHDANLSFIYLANNPAASLSKKVESTAGQKWPLNFLNV